MKLGAGARAEETARGDGVTWEVEAEASHEDLNGRTGCSISPRWSSLLVTQRTREGLAAPESTVA